MNYYLCLKCIFQTCKQVAEKPRGEHLKNDVCMYVCMYLAMCCHQTRLVI